MTDKEEEIWDHEQVAITVAGLIVTLLVAAETVLGLTNLISPIAEFGLLFVWLLWFLKLYAQERLPPMFPG